MTSMNVGMMWFDGDKRNSLESRIDRAVSYYREKYGQQPTVCFVNPNTAGDEPPAVQDVKLQTSASVLPDHFWLGIGQEPA
jgi:hypothetical protein